MKRWKIIIIGASAAGLVVLAVFVAATLWGKPWSIDHFYVRVFTRYMLNHPQHLSKIRIFEPLGLNFHNDELDDYSVEGTLRDQRHAADALHILHRYNLAKVDDKLSYKVEANMNLEKTIWLYRLSLHMVAIVFLGWILAFPAQSDTQKIQRATGFTDPVTGMVFGVLKGGCYQMGCGKWNWALNCESDEKPVRRVCLDTFLIGRHEVTQHQWEKIMGTNPAHAKECGSNCPVENVSWIDVQEFVSRLNAINPGRHRFRLPTEAEWEYACRSGGKPEMFCGGNKDRAVAWYLATSGNPPHPVGTKQPNGMDLYDMSDNVWEWCADYYGIYTAITSPNPKGPQHGTSRVIRGGGWGDYYPRFCRSAFRSRYLPHLKSKFIGFRLVVELSRRK